MTSEKPADWQSRLLIPEWEDRHGHILTISAREKLQYLNHLDKLREEDGVIPPRLAIDAEGYGWRVYDDHWSMIPTNPDNSSIPQPVTYYTREG